MAGLEKLKVIAQRVQRNGKPLIEDPQFATRMAKVEIELLNMATTNLRVIASVAGGGVPGAESSMLKIKGTVVRQELLSLIRRAMGPYALPFIEEAQFAEYADAPVGPKEAATAAAAYFNYRKLSIFGGSNEIQRNIISKMILGL
jgi:alkylation response protein AidB-like acyl-CoA dehydrogenase